MNPSMLPRAFAGGLSVVAALLAATGAAPVQAVESQTSNLHLAGDPCERVATAGWLGLLNTRDRELCLLRAQLTHQQTTTQVIVRMTPPRETSTAALPSTERTPVAQAGDTFRADQLLNLRSGPGVDHGLIGRVLQDQPVQLTGLRYGEWWQVKHTFGGITTTGWAFSLWLRRIREG